MLKTKAPSIIVCGIRHISPEASLKLADLCVKFKNNGVVGFDLAGAEENFPAKDHKEAFYMILNHNINATIIKCITLKTNNCTIYWYSDKP